VHVESLPMNQNRTARGNICEKNVVLTTGLTWSRLSQHTQGGGHLMVTFTSQCTISQRTERIDQSADRSYFNQTYEKDFECYGFGALTDFQSMLNDTFKDVVIKTTLGKEQKFPCHRFILIGNLITCNSIHNSCLM